MPHHKGFRLDERKTCIFSEWGVYIWEGIHALTLTTAVPHETTHVRKHRSFQPYLDFIQLNNKRNTAENGKKLFSTVFLCETEGVQW